MEKEKSSKAQIWPWSPEGRLHTARLPAHIPLEAETQQSGTRASENSLKEQHLPHYFTIPAPTTGPQLVFIDLGKWLNTNYPLIFWCQSFPSEVDNLDSGKQKTQWPVEANLL